MKIKIEFLNM